MHHRLTFGLFIALAVGCGEDEPDVAPTLYPLSVYTAFDESGGYEVPIAASGATGIAWKSSNEAVATISGNDTLATIVGKSAGTAQITGAVGDAKSTINVTVVQYTSADKSAGEALFTSTGCASNACHGPQAADDISPSVLAKHTDAEVIGAILRGDNPEGGDVRFENHEFPLTEAEQRSILAYVRSLEPSGPPEVDE
jgi:hypothetical protein